MFEIRNLWYPKENCQAELRVIFKEVAEQRQARGQITSVMERWFGPDGPVFVVAFFDDSLEAFESRQNDIAGRSNEMEYLERARALCSKHVMEMYEVLVPYPGITSV